jgi:hypothetical protein
MERMRTRKRLWWGDLGRRRPLHRVAELVVRRSRDDPDARWHCCEHWQRTLVNKWNGRELALRHGLRVPRLYWYGRRTAALPVESLPDHFVVRPVHGAGGRGVYVVAGDRELLGDVPLPRAALRPVLRRTLGRVARWPLLVEEFAYGEDGGPGLPTEYKCYAFGGTIGVIQVVHRTRRHAAAHRFYTPDWTPIADHFQTDNAPASPAAPPRCLDEILRNATTLGAACGTFIRVDCFATPAGCVFDEFATTPNDGRGFTPYADACLGELWQRTVPDRT